VLVLHDINFASWYSDYIVAMKHGRVAAQGPVADMIKPEVLSSIYEMDIKVHEIGGQRISVYYG
jgi:iron complex transport system ATP-binding protein